jgi:hypothetical protein
MKLSSNGTLLAVDGGEGIKLFSVNGHEVAPNPFGIILPSGWFALDPIGRFVVVVSFVNNHGTVPDKYVVKTWNAVDQKPLGSFDIGLANDAPLSDDPIAISSGGDVLAISANGSIYFCAVQQ